MIHSERTTVECADSLRIIRLIPHLLRQFDLDLRGLKVFTEAASGAYLYNPIMAALAGAERVFAITRDSHFAKAADVEHQTHQVATYFGVADRLDVVREKRAADINHADIITNTGFVRPIDAETIGWMKSTAVIPLMWETWEFRPTDLDLEACKRHGILVLGTNEHEPPCDMSAYSGFLAMRLIFDLGLEGHKTKTILLGAQHTLGGAIYRHLNTVGCKVTWFGSGDGEWRSYTELSAHFEQFGDDYDVLLVAEHQDGRPLLGIGGFLSYKTITRVNPALSIGVIAGNVDTEGLEKSGLFYLPKDIRPFGYMGYQPYILGPRPVVELYAAGLKVGETMARARLAGASIENAARYALANSPAMDFLGDHSWLDCRSTT